MGDETLLKSKGVQLFVLQDKATIEMMGQFIKDKPNVWNEDIGEK